MIALQTCPGSNVLGIPEVVEGEDPLLIGEAELGSNESPPEMVEGEVLLLISEAELGSRLTPPGEEGGEGPHASRLHRTRHSCLQILGVRTMDLQATSMDRFIAEWSCTCGNIFGAAGTEAAVAMTPGLSCTGSGGTSTPCSARWRARASRTSI